MKFQRTVYDLKNRKIKEKLNLVFLSDLHSQEYGLDNEDLLKSIAAEKPDLILCGGDMMIAQRGGRFRRAMIFLIQLRRIAPVIFSNGNHESELRKRPERYEKWLELLDRAGIQVVNNDSTECMVRGQKICIYGLELPLQKYRKFKLPHLSMEELDDLIGPPPISSEKLNILLAHNPQFMKQYLSWGADLTLSGHFHGGMMRLWKNQVLVSPYGFPFPKYGYGKFEENGHVGIVTSGLGDHTMPVRIHNPMEYVVIHCCRE